ncbi:unnamed protein product [Chondrus crispus]|uniref:TPR repeat-containing protein n=1 Tax=Chondrus crispus TaxID=2769 RepID=R7QBB8_CHOCR|nr:unnamed protein product [Chondrus crispus]CDF34716.1 unnamed protein product [Chondrus crispus]|eukprot:XP_005714535.1 unnamed protein product [Chondrus crispus]
MSLQQAAHPLTILRADVEPMVLGCESGLRRSSLATAAKPRSDTRRMSFSSFLLERRQKYGRAHPWAYLPSPSLFTTHLQSPSSFIGNQRKFHRMVAFNRRCHSLHRNVSRSRRHRIFMCDASMPIDTMAAAAVGVEGEAKQKPRRSRERATWQFFTETAIQISITGLAIAASVIAKARFFAFASAFLYLPQLFLALRRFRRELEVGSFAEMDSQGTQERRLEAMETMEAKEKQINESLLASAAIRGSIGSEVDMLRYSIEQMEISTIQREQARNRSIADALASLDESIRAVRRTVETRNQIESAAPFALVAELETSQSRLKQSEREKGELQSKLQILQANFEEAKRSGERARREADEATQKELLLRVELATVTSRLTRLDEITERLQTAELRNDELREEVVIKSREEENLRQSAADSEKRVLRVENISRVLREKMQGITGRGEHSERKRSPQPISQTEAEAEEQFWQRRLRSSASIPRPGSLLYQELLGSPSDGNYNKEWPDSPLDGGVQEKKRQAQLENLPADGGFGDVSTTEQSSEGDGGQSVSTGQLPVPAGDAMFSFSRGEFDSSGKPSSRTLPAAPSQEKKVDGDGPSDVPTADLTGKEIADQAGRLDMLEYQVDGKLKSEAPNVTETNPDKALEGISNFERKLGGERAISETIEATERTSETMRDEFVVGKASTPDPEPSQSISIDGSTGTSDSDDSSTNNPVIPSGGSLSLKPLKEGNQNESNLSEKSIGDQLELTRSSTLENNVSDKSNSPAAGGSLADAVSFNQDNEGSNAKSENGGVILSPDAAESQNASTEDVLEGSSDTVTGSVQSLEMPNAGGAVLESRDTASFNGGNSVSRKVSKTDEKAQIPSSSMEESPSGRIKGVIDEEKPGAAVTDSKSNDVTNGDSSVVDKADEASLRSNQVFDRNPLQRKRPVPTPKELVDSANELVKQARKRGVAVAQSDGLFQRAVSKLEAAMSLGFERPYVQAEYGGALLAWAKVNLADPASYKRLTKAQRYLSASLQTRPNDEDTVFNTALCLCLLGSTSEPRQAKDYYSRACELYDRLLGLNGTSRIGAFNCGLAYISLGRLALVDDEIDEKARIGYFETALERFGTAIELKPGDGKAQTYLEDCKRELSQLRQE